MFKGEPHPYRTPAPQVWLAVLGCLPKLDKRRSPAFSQGRAEPLSPEKRLMGAGGEMATGPGSSCKPWTAFKVDPNC